MPSYTYSLFWILTSFYDVTSNSWNSSANVLSLKTYDNTFFFIIQLIFSNLVQNID